MREYDKNLDLETVFWVYNQERKFADEEERISTQIQEDNAAINHEGDCLQPTTPNPEIGGNHGLFAECESQDDSAGEDVCSSSRTRQDASKESSRDKILASGHGSLRQKVQGPKARAKVTGSQLCLDVNCLMTDICNHSESDRTRVGDSQSAAKHQFSIGRPEPCCSLYKIRWKCTDP